MIFPNWYSSPQKKSCIRHTYIVLAWTLLKLCFRFWPVVTLSLVLEWKIFDVVYWTIGWLRKKELQFYILKMNYFLVPCVSCDFQCISKKSCKIWRGHQGKCRNCFKKKNYSSRNSIFLSRFFEYIFHYSSELGVY